MHRSIQHLCIGAGLIALAGCSAAGVSAGTNTSIAPITLSNTNATLQLGVGTLNNPYGLLGAPGVYLNSITTFRNPTGTAAFFHPGEAFLTGPGGLDADLGGLFAYGQAAGVNFTLGEPPAFSPQNLVGGYSTGYILTYAPPTPGTYTVQTTVAQDTSTLNFSANALLPNPALVLPNEPLPAWVTDGRGGGTFTMTNPASVTESLLFIQATNGAYVGDVELKSPATTANVPPGTLNAGQTYYVFCIGADFPMIESAPPNSSIPNPTIVGSGGTADITASDATTFTE